MKLTAAEVVETDHFSKNMSISGITDHMTGRIPVIFISNLY